MHTSSTTKRALPLAFLSAGALLLAGCGGSTTAGGSGSTAESAGATAGSTAGATSGTAGSATDASSSASGSAGSAPAGESIAVTLITKDLINPFFIAMQNGAKAAAEKDNVQLTVAAGREDGDEEGQVRAIEEAIARGDQGILITPSGPAVNPAIEQARSAGLYVVALDTPPEPADTVDITFATDNFTAGELIGQWTAQQLGGRKAVIALLDQFNDKIVTVDYNRDQGFLTGMGIDTKDPQRNGDEDPSGSYSGGEYDIVCNEPTGGAVDGGRTAMELCLGQRTDVNVVYTLNEPAAQGADAALKAAGITDAILVSVDGSCQGVADVQDGIIDATSQQYPLRMAELGVSAIATIARGGEKPAVTEGLDFFDTGVALITDTPADGVESLTAAEGAEICWG
ncbi:substrate-binding domain-containing protein [Nakamurella flavida]|uniref:Substrate-binding domain-containing protein n=1 Tax=Nakamurella flavida TaxID=363630 RepID=A0A939C499_9ACTN|nr:substrate-binding domain-containing protein [Nakamurella flavida]MBM9475007.1 substrate-binding domain-containing protein [Nakamurella flavida]MDP9776576.1 fructose transport system substrate-binding protein [Nakamurella flavida]